jgi:hypothetical protein
MIFPASKRLTQLWTVPFPFPMRISLGFLVNGVWANGRIQIRDFFLSFRARIRRPASIGRKARRQAFNAFIAKFPIINFDPPLE